MIVSNIFSLIFIFLLVGVIVFVILKYIINVPFLYTFLEDTTPINDLDNPILSCSEGKCWGK